jgi:hypothetical protein
MMRRAALIATIAAALAGPATALPGIPEGMPYRITADRGASWTLTCKFRAIRVWGRGLINQYSASERGPSHGALPSDNARCILTKTAGPGAVVLTLTKGKVVRTATALRAGASVKVSVL